MRLKVSWSIDRELVRRLEKEAEARGISTSRHVELLLKSVERKSLRELVMGE